MTNAAPAAALLALAAAVAVACGSEDAAAPQPPGQGGGAAAGAGGAGGSADHGGGLPAEHPKELPFTYTRPEQGEPVSNEELQAVTDAYLALLQGTRYLDFVAERVHGWPESDPEGRYWFGTWWSGVTVLKQGGKVTCLHGQKGADNNGLRTAPIMQSACYGFLLWGGAKREHLVRKLARGHSAWILAMEREPSDPAGPMLCRAFYPQSIASSDGGIDVFIDYGQNHPGEDADPSEYVHVPGNPYWGDIWIKNKRSKDDIGHMLRAIAQLDACQGRFSDPAAEQDLAEMYARYGAWCRKVEDDGWAIATLGKDGQPWLPPDLLARFVDVGNAECTSMLALHLFGRGSPGGFECGNGIGPLDEAIMAGADHNGNIIRSFHEAAANAALLANRPELAQKLIEGLAERIVQGLDGFQGIGPEVPHLDPESQVDLMVQAASVGVPLTWREVRWLHERILDAQASYLAPENAPVYATFDQVTPDGSYAFTPSGSGIEFRHLGTLLALCAAQYRNPAGKPVLDCAKLQQSPP